METKIDEFTSEHQLIRRIGCIFDPHVTLQPNIPHCCGHLELEWKILSGAFFAPFEGIHVQQSPYHCG
jgi:hypothetical protein